MTDRLRQAVMDFDTGKCACVLLQAVYGGDSSLPHLFDVDRWELGPRPGFIPVKAPHSWWLRVADSEPEAFHQHLADLAGVGFNELEAPDDSDAA